MECLPNLPPFGVDQSLANNKPLDILLCGTPKSWQKEMEHQGFDPMDEATTNKVVEFMEQIEATEDFKPENKPSVKQNGSIKKKKSGDNNNKKGQKESLHCVFHGQNNSHSTNHCTKMKEQAKCLKMDSVGSSSKKDHSSKSKNKTWSRKAKEGEASDKSDLAAFVQKQVKKGVQKCATKKRKSDDSSNDELNTFYLKDFNREDMDNLKIDSDDEFSC